MTKPTPPTHDELRDRYVAQQPLTRFDGVQWWRYHTTHWQPLNTGYVLGEVDSLCVAAKPEGIRPTRALTMSVLGMVGDKPGVFVEPACFDADPDLLPCQNGVLVLSKRRVIPHDPAHYNTSVLPYSYDVNATAPRWQYYLDTTLQPDVAAFLQEFAGYCLTTDTKLETAVWLYGPRGSGKSTFITGLITMLGKRAGMLGLGEIARSHFALWDIPGKTLLFATEQPSGTVNVTHKLNQIISGEPILIERKYQNQQMVVPRAKICWAMDELPSITNSSGGLLRRVKVVPFPKRETPVIPEIKEAIESEGDGILNWALQGLNRLWRNECFTLPPAVLNATSEYEHNSDTTLAYVEDCCERGDGYRVQAGILYTSYVDWCKARGMYRTIKTLTTMAEEWKRLGFSKTISEGRTYWCGVRLRIQPFE